MKTLLPTTFLFCFISFFIFSQKNINLFEIENYCFEQHNKLRPSNDQRSVSDICMKTANVQLDYLYNGGKISHSNPNKGLEEPEERFKKFNKDSIKVKNTSSIKGYTKKEKYSYDSEIITFISNFKIENDYNVNKKIAEKIISNFNKSEFHKKLMLFSYDGFDSQGYFSVKVKVLNENENTLTIDIYCVAIFSSSYKQ
jgi:hypothetical protein